MDLTFITDMYIPLVLLACLVIGYILKKWIQDVDNKWIPTILCIIGAVLACTVSRTISLSVIVAGAVSGLASTGLHQMFKQLIENGPANGGV